MIICAVERRASLFKERAERVAFPDGIARHAHVTPPASAGGDSALGDNQRHVPGDAIVTPYFQDVLHDSRFHVKRVPVVRWSEAIDEERIVFEGHEREVLKMSVGLQVIDESAHPGSPALVVHPKGDVFIDAFENRAAQFGRQ